MKNRVKIFQGIGFGNLESAINKWLEEKSDTDQIYVTSIHYQDNKDYASALLYYTILQTPKL